MLFATGAGLVACPFEFVTAVAITGVELAPLAGAVNVTVAPLTGLPKASLTLTCRPAANALPTTAVCGEPETTAIAAADPALFVRLNDVAPDTPGTVADTL